MMVERFDIERLRLCVKLMISESVSQYDNYCTGNHRMSLRDGRLFPADGWGGDSWWSLKSSDSRLGTFDGTGGTEGSDLGVGHTVFRFQNFSRLWRSHPFVCTQIFIDFAQMILVRL